MLDRLFGNGRDGVTMSINDDVLSVIDNIKLKLTAGFDDKKIDAYLARAGLEGAKYLEPFIEDAAPIDTGRLSNSIRAKIGRYKKPSAIVGIYRGKSRQDHSGAYYGRPVVSGTGDQWSYPGAKSMRGLLRKELKPILGGGRGGVARATELLRDRGFYDTYLHEPLPSRPFVEETAERHLDEVKEVVSDTLDRILQDEVFRDTIKIGKGR